MKLLVISYLFPYPPDSGYKLRVYNTIKELSKNNEVDLISLDATEIEMQQIEKMEILCHKIWLGKKPRLSYFKKALRHVGRAIHAVPMAWITSWDREKIILLNESISDNRYEAVIAEHILSGHLVNTRKNFREKKFVIVNHNVEHDLYRNIHFRKHSIFRPYYAIQVWLMKRREKEINLRSDLCVVMSEEDRKIFSKLSSSINPIIVPNGVDIKYFYFRKKIPQKHDFYYVGNLQYYPNIDAVEFFINEAFPHVLSKVADCRFFIIGGNPSRAICKYHNGNNVIVTGYVDDIRKYAKNCRACIVPLRLGSGTRLKIVEALSMGVPVISTSKGAEGLEINSGKNIIIANESIEFAEGLTNILLDEKLSITLAKNGRHLVEDKYSWTSLVEKFKQELANVMI